MRALEILSITERTQEPLLDRFHAGIYMTAFAAQHEPLDVWKKALWRPDAPYRMHVRLAVEGDEILGGITCELYPRSQCGIVTYVVVAPSAQRSGLGKQLRTGAARGLYSDGARAVFGEVNDPRVPRDYETPDTTWRRLERYQRWGSRVVNTRYIQPSLGPGLERDRKLVLLRHASGDSPPPVSIAGAIVRDFLAEFFEVTEGSREPDAELREILDGISDEIGLIELVRES